VAINLWKLAGKPTSYNPLPTGWNNQINFAIGEYVLTFKARSNTNAYLRISNTTTGYTFDGVSSTKLFQLTNTLTTYSVAVKITTSQGIGLTVWDNVGGTTATSSDIIIDSIELVQKPLPKLTINGVDGFTSGKWVIHANAQVVDDETLVLNATGGYQASTLLVPVLANQPIVFSGYRKGRYVIYELDGSGATLNVPHNDASDQDGTLTKNFTTGSSTKTLKIEVSSTTIGQFTFKRPMLNLGVTALSYSRKTGDRMVLPSTKGKNLFDYKSYCNALTSSGNYGNAVSIVEPYGFKIVDRNNVSTLNFNLKPNTNYTISYSKSNSDTVRCEVYDMLNSGVRYYDSLNITDVGKISFTTNNSTSHRIKLHSTNGVEFYNVQLEEGSTVTSYEPYNVQLNKKPKHSITKPRTGLAFNGVSDYLQLPSMTMDSIEIDCFIDSVQPQSQAMLMDARNGLTNGFVFTSTAYQNNGSGIQSVSGFTFGSRTKIKITPISSFTDDVTIFRDLSGGANRYTKGTIYKVTCYLNGGVVAQYDFENPSNVVGNTVLPKANNLIPSFEDPRWSLHSSAKVYGRDYLHVDYTSSGGQGNTITLDVLPNTNYLLISSYGTNASHRVRAMEIGTNNIIQTVAPDVPNGRTFNAGSRNKIYIMLEGNAVLGGFDFIKPQLYALDGKEGTLNGTPAFARKQTKRALYSKR
jgi:hypothetical protein